MVVLDDVENAKLNSRYFDLEAKTLNKVAANINSFTVTSRALQSRETNLFSKTTKLQTKTTKRIRIGHITHKVDQAEWGELGTHKNVLTHHFRFSRPDCLVHPQPCASPKPN